MRRPVALVLAALAAASCGGSGAPAPRPPGAQLDPPEAAEPARSPAPDAEPAGRLVRVGGPVEGLAVDGDTGLVAAARQDEPSLLLVDPRAARVRRTVRLPAAPRHLALAGPGGPVLVPAEEADELVRVDPATGAAERVRVGDHPHDAASARGRVFTVDEFGSTLSVAGGRRVPVDAQPGGVVAVGDSLAVISVRAYTIELFDPRTLRGGGSQSAGLGPTHAEADAEGRVYVTDTRGDALVVFATRPRLRFLARVPLRGAPYGIAVDAERRSVWVTLTARNELVKLSAGDRPRVLRTLPTVRQPNTVAVDPRDGSAVVGSANGDVVQIVD
jgi:DNA-binding beta-propeller fold protein YncE